MRIGNYWDESQVVIIDLQTMMTQDGKSDYAAPALAATITGKDGLIRGVIFVEAIPGTEHYGEYTSPGSSQRLTGNVVKINVHEGPDIKNLKLMRSDVWLIEWFGLTQLPQWKDPAIAAFDHAMGIV